MDIATNAAGPTPSDRGLKLACIVAIEDLSNVQEWLDEQADVRDCDDGSVLPNEPMNHARAIQRVKTLLARIRDGDHVSSGVNYLMGGDR